MCTHACMLMYAWMMCLHIFSQTYTYDTVAYIHACIRCKLGPFTSVCACMYVCVHTHAYTCYTCGCTCLRTYSTLHTNPYWHMYTCIRISWWFLFYTCACTCTYFCVAHGCMYVCAHVCSTLHTNPLYWHIYIYVHTYVHKHIHAYMAWWVPHCTWMYLCGYAYLYVHVHICSIYAPMSY